MTFATMFSAKGTCKDAFYLRESIGFKQYVTKAATENDS